ncbi:MAG TPA: hypothetical protein VJB94_02600 [Candidatus Nanoarchaeia archaeon]|nr:hypothetical protein [Candidatus Nanoarchaeia archaeon]
MRLSLLTKDFELEKIPSTERFNWKDVNLLTTLDANPELTDFLKSHPENFGFRQVNLNGSSCSIVYDKLFLPDFPEVPYKSTSEGSQAVYLARNPSIPNALLLQMFKERSDITSRHYHKETEETYFSMEGSCVINEDDKDILLMDNIHTVNPKKWHPLTAIKPSLNLLIMKGPHGLSKVDHHFK